MPETSDSNVNEPAIDIRCQTARKKLSDWLVEIEQSGI